MTFFIRVAFIRGQLPVFDFRVGPEEKHIWPQMNVDGRG
jgi:hypothetical protein